MAVTMSMNRMVASAQMIRAGLCLEISLLSSDAVLPPGDKYKDCPTFRRPLEKGLA